MFSSSSSSSSCSSLNKNNSPLQYSRQAKIKMCSFSQSQPDQTESKQLLYKYNKSTGIIKTVNQNNSSKNNSRNGITASVTANSNNKHKSFSQKLSESHAGGGGEFHHISKEELQLAANLQYKEQLTAQLQQVSLFSIVIVYVDVSYFISSNFQHRNEIMSLIFSYYLHHSLYLTPSQRNNILQLSKTLLQSKRRELDREKLHAARVIALVHRDMTIKLQGLAPSPAGGAGAAASATDLVVAGQGGDSSTKYEERVDAAAVAQQYVREAQHQQFGVDVDVDVDVDSESVAEAPSSLRHTERAKASPVRRRPSLKPFEASSSHAGTGTGTGTPPRHDNNRHDTTAQHTASSNIDTNSSTDDSNTSMLPKEAKSCWADVVRKSAMGRTSSPSRPGVGGGRAARRNTLSATMAQMISMHRQVGNIQEEFSSPSSSSFSSFSARRESIAASPASDVSGSVDGFRQDNIGGSANLIHASATRVLVSPSGSGAGAARRSPSKKPFLVHDGLDSSLLG